MGFTVRQPNGLVADPRVLLAGPEGTGKTYQSLLLSASVRIGHTYVLQIGEITADEYGAIPGARFELIEHDGRWVDIIDAARFIHAQAVKAREAGEKPHLWSIDSATLEWDMLKDWTGDRAKKNRKIAELLRKDPDAFYDVPRNYWNDAERRHKQLMRLVLTYPGVVVITARAKWVSGTDAHGQPTAEKVWSIDAHKSLVNDCSVVIRLEQGEQSKMTKVRSVAGGILPEDPPEKMPKGWTLEQLIFGRLKYNPAVAVTTRAVELDPSALDDSERATEAEVAADQERRERAAARQLSEEDAGVRARTQAPAEGAASTAAPEPAEAPAAASTPESAAQAVQQAGPDVPVAVVEAVTAANTVAELHAVYLQHGAAMGPARDRFVELVTARLTKIRQVEEAARQAAATSSDAAA